MISSHPAAALSTDCVFTLSDPVQVALTTSSRVTLTPNPWSGVIQMPATTATGSAVGVATYIINAGEYGWVQTRGACGVLIQGTPAVGNCVVVPSSTAGACTTDPANAATQIIGSIMVAGANGEVNQVLLNIV